jgi:uncharacterized membrane protein
MATDIGRQESQSRWVRPLVPIAIVLVASIVFLFIGSIIASASASYRGQSAAPFEPLRMVPFLVAGAVLVYGLAVLATDERIWKVSTREVVFMAIGAALYGVLSWATNLLQLPSVSLVSLRPAIVIPIFFGVVFGPAVGFFTGFVGNVLGDALTGWGVFPIWDLGNGLIGLVAGLSLSFKERPRVVDILTALVAVVGVVATAMLLVNPVIIDPNGDGTATLDASSSWWLPLVAVALVVALRFALRGRAELVGAQLWGSLGIMIGIGFAALADIWWNGYNLFTAVIGEFVPAAGSNLINALVLLPLLLTAWNAARAQSGR